jgi:hypothetical protein
MRHVRPLTPLVVGMFGLAAAWGAVAAGCGDDTASTPPADGGGTDSTTDSAVDVIQGDVVGEAAKESGPDAGAPDGDAGVVDSGVAYDGTAASFPGQLASTLCARVAACCGTSPDAATFNLALCLADEQSGFNGSSTGSNLLDGGHLVFNAVAAQSCLDLLQQIDCTTNQIASGVEMQSYASCFATYTGTLTAGSACANTIECAPGSFCLPVDGGVGDAGAIGVCQALAGDGGACALLGNASASQSVCSDRGSGNTGLFCQSFDPSAPTEVLDAAAWTCGPQEPIGTGCAQAVDCTSFECTPLPTRQCATSIVAVSAAACTAFAVEAGTDAAGD